MELDRGDHVYGMGVKHSHGLREKNGYDRWPCLHGSHARVELHTNMGNDGNERIGDAYEVMKEEVGGMNMSMVMGAGFLCTRVENGYEWLERW